MTQERLRKLINAYEKRAKRAYDNYQDSGVSRYYSDHNRWEEIADALRQLESTNEEHNAYIHLRSTMAYLLNREKDAESCMSTADLFEKYRIIVHELRALMEVTI